MPLTLLILQLLVALGIYNVWLIRPRMKTAYRGKGASNLKQEFLAYGLSVRSMYFIGAIKLLTATALILGIWYPIFTKPGAFVLAIMMAGAVLMHLKVGDSFKRYVPALFMFVASAMIFLLG